MVTIAVSFVVGLALGAWFGCRFGCWAVRGAIQRGMITESDIRNIRAKRLAESRA